MTLYFITGNKKKYEEISLLLGIPIKQFNVDLPEIQEIDSEKIISAKLQEAIKLKKNEPDACFIVEDTSLYFDCLNNLPGPLIKWFFKQLGNHGLFTLTENYKSFGAIATTIIGYYNNGKISYIEGSVKGTIVKPRVDNGFGWDPIFIPEGSDKTFAQMSEKEKNLISQRMKAVKKLKTILKKDFLQEKEI